jgi:hypothetical protein
MLIEYDKWQDEDEDDDVAADFPEFSMDQRIIDLRRGPGADRVYAESGNMLKWNAGGLHSCGEH